MCSTHWPKLLDLTRDESKRMLRSLELEAYASTVTALRAQGDLTSEKKKVLQDLQSFLSISLERHKAEVRRAVNDEKLTTIADHMSGSSVSSEWLIEGRRLVPLMPRLVPQTAFTATANTAANAQAEKNISLPPPGQTGKDIYAPPPPPSSLTTPTQLKTSGRPQSPPSNVVHLPSGMSIHIKGEIKDEDSGGKTPSFIGPASDLVIVTRSSSVSVAATSAATESSSSVPAPLVVIPNIPPQLGGPGVPSSVTSPVVTSTNPISTQNQPMRVTVAKSPVKSQVPPLPIGGGPVTAGKVVVMSTIGNSNNSNIDSSINTPINQVTLPSQQHQQTPSHMTSHRPVSGLRPVSMPMTMITTPQIVHSRPYVTTVISSGLSSTSTSLSGTVATATIGGPPGMVPAATFSSAAGNSGIEIVRTAPSVSLGISGGTVASPHVLSTQRMATAYPRTRTIITRPRVPFPHTPGQRSTIVIPAGSGGTHGNSSVIRTSGPRPAIHIKQEGSMKIITQAVPMSSKVITKPTSSGSPVVVISTGASSLPLATRVSVAGSKILNISSGATRVITASRQAGGNVVTVNPKSFHLGSVKGNTSATALTPSGSKLTTAAGGKPNVIVVQKAGSHTQKKIMTAVSQQMGGAYSQISSAPKSSGAIQVMTPTATQNPAPPNFSQGAPVPRTPPSGVIQSPYEKELMSFIQKQDRQVLSQQQRVERRLAPKMELQHMHPNTKKITVVRQKADGSTTSQPIVITQGAGQVGGATKSSILAELISAVNHPPTQKISSEGDVMLMEEQQAVSSITKQLDTTSKDGAMVQNQWVEMDAPIGQSAESSDTSAIKALLDLQQGHRVKVRRDSAKSVGYESTQRGGVQTPQSEIITIDQSGNIVQQVMGEGSVESSGEVQYVQSGQRQIHIKQQGGEFVNEAGQPLRIEVSTEEELAQMENVVSQEIIGELDPNTGILYTNSPIEGQHIINTGEISSITPLSSQTSGVSVSSIAEMTSISHSRVVTSGYQTPPEVLVMAGAGDGAENQPQTSEMGDQYKQEEDISEDRQDFLTTALDQADISLDPYEYVPDNDPDARSQGGLVQRSRPQEIVIQGSRSDVVHVSQPHEVVLQARSNEGHQSVQPSEVVVHGRRLSFTQGEGLTEERVLRVIPPSQEAEVEFGLEGFVDSRSESQSQVQVVKDDSGLQSRIPDVIADVMPSQNASEDNLIQTRILEMTSEDASLHGTTITMETAAVAVETADGMDPTSLHLSELTSQNIEGEVSYSVGEHGLIHHQKDLLESPPAGSSQESLSDSQNKRKRKPPPRPDELILQNQVSGWTRMALGLVHKVSKYRGVYKQKGQLNAASWFTHPVNPTEVPDYYAIIQTPMDFSTIKRKLETNCYRDWSDFHGDMMLIRDNCYQYNDASSEVRTDCDEVFAYYLAEYDKTLQKYQQSQMTSPNSKKPRLDRSPVRQQPL